LRFSEDARSSLQTLTATNILGAQIVGRHYITALRQPDCWTRLSFSARTGPKG